MIFAAHIAYERLRLRSTNWATALNTALAVALGAFGLAAAATIRRFVIPSPTPAPRFILALILWPIFTGVPAFVAAWCAAFLLGRVQGARSA